jgi:hypothetical protein
MTLATSNKRTPRTVLAQASDPDRSDHRKNPRGDARATSRVIQEKPEAGGRDLTQLQRLPVVVNHKGGSHVR